jgi:hypothetical protein
MGKSSVQGRHAMYRLAVHQHADAVVGQQLEQHRVRSFAVHDDRALEAGGQP